VLRRSDPAVASFEASMPERYRANFGGEAKITPQL